MINTSGSLRFVEQESGGLELAEPWWCDLGFPCPNGTIKNLKVKRARMFFAAGFEWDGASGPTIDPERWAPPPLVHDGCYRMIRRAAWPMSLRKPADKLFLAMLLERTADLPWWRRQLAKARAYAWYAGVRIGGRWSARPTRDPETEVHEVA